MSRAAPGLWLAAALAAAGLLAGCGGGDDSSEPRPQRPATAPGTVRFEGGAIPGVLYVAAGQDPLNADVYRIEGSLDRAQRLTEGARISSLSASRAGIVTANARGSGNDRVETLVVEDGRARPGRVLDPDGHVPVVSDGGRVAYTLIDYARDGEPVGTQIRVTDLAGRDRRVLMRASSDLTAAWAPGDRLVVFSQLLRDEPPPDRARIILDPGTAEQRVVDPGVARATDVLVAPDGRMVTGDTERVVVLARNGRRLHAFAGDWGPLCFAPDGRLLAVRGATLGLMSIDDGSVREIGRTIGGQVLTAAWVAS